MFHGLNHFLMLLKHFNNSHQYHHLRQLLPISIMIYDNNSLHQYHHLRQQQLPINSSCIIIWDSLIINSAKNLQLSPHVLLLFWRKCLLRTNDPPWPFPSLLTFVLTVLFMFTLQFVNRTFWMPSSSSFLTIVFFSDMSARSTLLSTSRCGLRPRASWNRWLRPEIGMWQC